MPRVDPMGNRCDRLVRIHIRQVHNVNDIYKAIRCAQRLYGKHGIYVDVPTVAAIQMRVDDLTRLSNVDTACEWNQSSADQAELFARYGVQDFASITAFFVQILSVGPRDDHGCAGHSPHRPAVFINRLASPWVLSHEIGHVLLTSKYRPIHHGKQDNIMNERCTYFTETDSPDFNFLQVDQIRRSAYVLPC